MTTTTTTLTRLWSDDLDDAEKGSYYTISGCGGDLQEWVDGYNQWLDEEGIGTPAEWFVTSGESINAYAGLDNTNPYPPDLAVLMFPLRGLDVGRLAIFKITHEDRWFDDIVQNMRREG